MIREELIKNFSTRSYSPNVAASIYFEAATLLSNSNYTLTEVKRLFIIWAEKQLLGLLKDDKFSGFSIIANEIAKQLNEAIEDEKHDQFLKTLVVGEKYILPEGADDTPYTYLGNKNIVGINSPYPFIFINANGYVQEFEANDLDEIKLY